MGHVKEPYGVDLEVNPRPVNAADKAAVKEAIAYYKKTGKKVKVKSPAKSKDTSEQKKVPSGKRKGFNVKA